MSEELQMFHEEETENLMAPVALLRPGINFRQDKTPDQELLDSIHERGVTTPLLVRDGGDGTLHIIDGERRYWAARKLGIKALSIRLCKGQTDVEAIFDSLSTQTRCPFTQIELANAYSKLIELGLSSADISKQLGVGSRTVVEALRVAKNAVDELKKSSVPSRAKARAATLPANEQRKLTPKLEKAKNTGEAMHMVRQAEKDLKKKTRGVKAADTKPVIKNFRDALDNLERRVNRDLRAEPKSIRFRVVRDTVDYFRGIGSLEDLMTGKK